MPFIIPLGAPPASPHPPSSLPTPGLRLEHLCRLPRPRLPPPRRGRALTTDAPPTPAPADFDREPAAPDAAPNSPHAPAAPPARDAHAREAPVAPDAPLPLAAPPALARRARVARARVARAAPELPAFLVPPSLLELPCRRLVRRPLVRRPLAARRTIRSLTVTLVYVSGSLSLGKETMCLAESYHVGGYWIDEVDDGTKHLIHEEKRRIVGSPKTWGSVVLISPCGRQEVIRSPRALCNPRPHTLAPLAPVPQTRAPNPPPHRAGWSGIWRSVRRDARPSDWRATRGMPGRCRRIRDL